ncbi:MAG: SIR2 family protein [Promethearchaeota archaeon]
MSIDEDILFDISEQINNNRMILFLGAGSTRLCQKKDGKPGLSGQELADEILTNLNDGKNPGFQVSLTKAADFYTASAFDGRNGLDNFIKTRLLGLQPTLGHFLITLFPWKAIITTNYNMVIEEAYKIANQEGFALKNLIPVRQDEELDGLEISASDTILFKPHGCISLNTGEKNRLIITSRDHFEARSLRPKMYKELNSIVKESSTIFIGYSMDEYTFRNIYYDLQDQLGLWRMRLYNVSRKKHNLLFKWTEKSLDRDFNTTLVRTSFDTFMVNLYLFLRKSISPSLKKRINSMWQDTVRLNKPYLDNVSLERILSP